jgi:hypothetical protein
MTIYETLKEGPQISNTIESRLVKNPVNAVFINEFLGFRGKYGETNLINRNTTIRINDNCVIILSARRDSNPRPAD